MNSGNENSLTGPGRAISHIPASLAAAKNGSNAKTPSARYTPS